MECIVSPILVLSKERIQSRDQIARKRAERTLLVKLLKQKVHPQTGEWLSGKQKQLPVRIRLAFIFS